MTNVNNQCIHIYYYIITEQISFIPNNIVKNCKFIPFSRPTRQEYKKCIQQNIQYHENGCLEGKPKKKISFLSFTLVVAVKIIFLVMNI